MPPKKSDLHHITFHFGRSAVLLSVPGSTSLTSLKTQLLPALVPLANTLASPPKKAADIRLYDERSEIEGGEGLRDLESEEGAATRTIAALGWTRWKKAYVSFRGEGGTFSEPEYTIPDVDDEAPEEA